MKTYRIRVKKPWMAYPGSTLQQNYAEDLKHGYLKWEITDRDNFNVDFYELPNEKPYVTVDWQKDAKTTFSKASIYPTGSRFRIRSSTHLAQQEVQTLTAALKQQHNATEVTFKIDQDLNKSVITTGTSTFLTDDLRNHDVLLKFLKDFYKDSRVTDDEWDQVHDKLKAYISWTPEEAMRNAKWTLRYLQFDNTFGFGEGNIINFEKLNGIVGIFGQNRSGKSATIGSVMYSLFNTTDRGPVKNQFVCNVRKPYCYAKALINVNGSDYVIERQTTKHENKWGVVNASTALNVFKIVDESDAIDLAGEQRTDTEKVIRNLIGTSDDFLMTSLSSQGEINQFISNGSAKRRQILSRFLDIDVCDRLFDMANRDVNSTKAHLRAYQERDWNSLADGYRKQLDECASIIADRTQLLQECHERLNVLRNKLVAHKDFTPVTKTQVDNQQIRVTQLEKHVTSIQDSLAISMSDLEKFEQRIKSIDEFKEDWDLIDLKKRLEALKVLEASVLALKHVNEKEASILKQQERSLKILDEVPCGDAFPTCKFIKDAHVVKEKVSVQRERVAKTLEKVTKATEALDELKKEDIQARVDKIEQINDRRSKFLIDASNKKVDIIRLESSLEGAIAQLEPTRSKLEELQEALKNEENEEVVSLRSEIDEIVKDIKHFDDEKLSAAALKGKVISDIEKSNTEKKGREVLLREMKVYELIANAFCRRGIPNMITKAQLPVINSEIAKILHGIVDYTIELEADDETDLMDVYINYGDSRRIIELASGMEKMISSIAIRVALINISSLPKTDMFIIDEGFGSLDDSIIEACNRLLKSLKRYFKTVMVITHVDSIKDAADVILEITKQEKDAHVVYE